MIKSLSSEEQHLSKIRKYVKGTVCKISSYSPCKDDNVRLTTGTPEIMNQNNNKVLMTRKVFKSDNFSKSSKVTFADKKKHMDILSNSYLIKQSF